MQAIFKKVFGGEIFKETQKKHKPLQITPWQQVEVPMIQFQERLVEVPCVETREEPTEAQTKMPFPMAWTSQNFCFKKWIFTKV